MSRFLMLDIGAGTLDLLYYDALSGEHFKAVMPAPVRQVAEEIEQTQGPLAVKGVEMGGGPVSDALRRRAQTAEVVICAEAAATLHHDLDKVRGWGLNISDDAAIERIWNDPAYTPMTLEDVQTERIAQVLKGMGLPTQFEAVAICGQDHGLAPKGTSHLEFRHALFQRLLDESPLPHRLLFRDDEVPAAFNLLRAMARSARRFDTQEVYVMDSGMAAMAGAAQDAQALGREPILILDVATSHTVVAALEGDQIAGFVEYHTRDITLDRLEALLRELADGRTSHDQILAEGGHGAYLRKTVGFDRAQAIIATGPKRRLLAQSRLPILW
ncbi:MAG: pyruvate formate-lyase activating enzyme, partial [Desulfatitalea sp.]|nr:pyruvate formate-lyase activating enzyme [Desulfatitalea sp.]